ncbi:MAG: response regulator transcription factor [Vulcanimicrobiaceae bacterium]
MRVLIIEDNETLAGAVRTMLERRKMAVDVVHDGEAGLDCLLRDAYDIALVDVMLPSRDGFSIARSAREQGIHTPILMLTARDAVEDRVDGLDSGADDYLVKPFVAEELIARMNALSRRGDRPLAAALKAGKLDVNLAARTAHYDGRPLELGSTEFRLLEFFVRNAGRTFTRAQLLERIWDYDFDGSSNIVDVYVSQLRKKLRAAGASKTIATVWGVGYRLIS